MASTVTRIVQPMPLHKFRSSASTFKTS